MARHLIHSQKLDLRYTRVTQAKADLDDWGARYQGEFLPVIAEVLDDLEIPGETTRIDKLEIDLGRISGNLDPDVLKQKLKEALKTQILREVPKLRRESPEKESKSQFHPFALDDQKDLELLVYLLETGRKPWWALPSKRAGVKSLFQKLFRQEKSPSLRTWLESQQLSSQAAERLINHLNYSELLDLIAWVFPRSEVAWRSFSASLEEALTPEIYSKAQASVFLSSILIESFLVRKSESIAPTSIWLRKSPAFSSGGKIQKTEVFLPLLEAVASRGKPIATKALLAGAAERWLDSPFVLTHTELRSGISRAEKEVAIQEFLGVFSEKSTKITVLPEEKQHSFSLKKTQQIRPLEMEETFPISNAGLVLTAPFLPYFFAGLGLLEKKEFVSTDAQNRAALLIQALLDESHDYEESDLLLNKILCGIAPGEAIPVAFSPTDLEKEEIPNLLDSMTQQWTALKSTSGRSMAQGFFPREGSLRKVDKGYQLQIPRISIDILLNRLSWTISIIKLPWMNETLFVEW
ncbi:contractile injection system tape measure protein [Algoriphagus terrigena]|uniref:contractile injection system tape measure protein n=1 Tax=Algoriphagus terrigena TaxID=344884 RepID=UPI0004217FA5|nr:contractile injection system tape measure protein [Algoriphagus terrigena]